MVEGLEQIIQLEHTNYLNEEIYVQPMNKRKFLQMLGFGTAAATVPSLAQAGNNDVINYQRRMDIPELVNADPLFSLMYDRAIEHTGNKRDGEILQSAILNFVEGRHKAAAHNLLHSYNLDKFEASYPKMIEIGGNNCTYFVLLNLVCEKLPQNLNYEAIIKYINDDDTPNRPDKLLIFEFVENIIPASVKGISQRLNTIPRYAQLFNYQS
jgi:hypothetical protein